MVRTPLAKNKKSVILYTTEPSAHFLIYGNQKHSNYRPR